MLSRIKNSFSHIKNTEWWFIAGFQAGILVFLIIGSIVGVFK